MKLKMKKYGKMILIFEFSISKLSYMAVENFFDPSCTIFLSNRGKNGDKDEIFGKMSSIFEFSIFKIRL